MCRQLPTCTLMLLTHQSARCGFIKPEQKVGVYKPLIILYTNVDSSQTFLNIPTNHNAT
jgi:hypothetical protein